MKIPQEYGLLVDENLRARNLAMFGFEIRAHVVRTAVYEFPVRHEYDPRFTPDDMSEQA